MLLLAKIENDRFPEKSELDLGDMIADAVSLHDEIYAHKDISSSVSRIVNPVVTMNEQMASVLVGNLVKNAYVHSSVGSCVEVHICETGFSISNPGAEPLDRNRLFQRFYQPGGRKEGSSGLGLALVYSVCERNGFSVSYDFRENRHIFSVNLKNSK
jgi:signal transduction histidine kinase